MDDFRIEWREHPIHNFENFLGTSQGCSSIRFWIVKVKEILRRIKVVTEEQGKALCITRRI